MDSSTIQLILFDLGGVLLEFDGINPLVDLSQGALSHDAARRVWLNSPSIRRFETGRCSPGQFCADVIAELGLPVEPAEFLAHFLSWERGPFEGSIQLLQSLRRKHRIACLSNNNELHWHVVQEKFALDRLFHHCYLSHQIGLMKPDSRIYEHVLADQQLAPDRVLFIDDNPVCVQGAIDVGMVGRQASGVSEVREILLLFGLEA